MFLRKSSILISLVALGTLSGYGQSSIELIPSGGVSFADNVAYDRSAGRINSTFLFSFSFIYHPAPVVGLELSYLDENPTTYLSNPDEPKVKVYTSGKININRLLGGANFFLPGKRVRPYLGSLIGFTHVNTTNPIDVGTYAGFTWEVQGGADVYISSLIGIRYRIAFIQTPNVSNNSAYFNVRKSGDGFPTFAIGDPSSANLNQVNMGLGIIFHFSPGSRKGHKDW